MPASLMWTLATFVVAISGCRAVYYNIMIIYIMLYADGASCPRRSTPGNSRTVAEDCPPRTCKITASHRGRILLEEGTTSAP
jgi:hypothetical protein